MSLSQAPLLGPRPIEGTRVVNAVAGRSIEDRFGFPDNLQFRSSMTLFAHAHASNGQFALAEYFQRSLGPIEFNCSDRDE
jgi:uncharacterized protein (DUF1810 family)